MRVSGGAGRVLAFRYENALHLSRDIAAVKGRSGRDALFVVARPYEAIATLESGAEGRRYPFPIRVPAGFLTDLSSISRFGRGYVGRVGPHLEASVVHDCLCASWRIQGAQHRLEGNRELADDVFLAAMTAARVGRCRRQIMYRAVRWFGVCAFYQRSMPAAILAWPKP